MVFSQSIPGREIRLGLAGSDLPGSGLPGRACRVRLTVLGLPGSGLPGRVLYPHEQMSGWVCKGVENSGEIFGHIRLLFSLLLIYLSYKCFVFFLVMNAGLRCSPLRYPTESRPGVPSTIFTICGT